MGEYYNIHVNIRDILENSSKNGHYLRAENGDKLANTPFNEQVVANKTTVIELKSIYGLSDIRDTVTFSGTGQVINQIGDREYDVSVSGASSFALLESVERGRYIAGKTAEYGLGIRLSSDVYSGDTVAEWGAINGTNGFYFGQDSGGKYVAIKDDGVETRIDQADWNKDTLDGQGGDDNPSGQRLNTADGQVFFIEFTWYGYGVISFGTYIKDKNGGGLRRVIVHNYVVDGKTSIKTPNLPIGVRIENGTSTDTEHVYVGGRQFSVLGSYNPTFRSTSEFSIGKSIPTSGIVPLISFRQKEAYKVINGKVDGLDILTDEDLLIEIYIGTTLTGAVWQNPTRKLATETAYESDISATALNVTGADLIFRTLVPGGTGGAKAVGEEDLLNLILDFPEDLIITVVGQSLGVSAADSDVVFRLKEEW